MAKESQYADKSYHEKVSQQISQTTGPQIESLSKNVDSAQKTYNNDNLSTSTKATALVLNAVDTGIQAFGAITGVVDDVLGAAIMPLLEGLGMKGTACLPISKQLDPVLGIDIHMVTIPPSPAPVPMPHPYIGMLFRPKDFLAAAIASYIPPPPTPPEMSENPTEGEQDAANEAQALTLAHTVATMVVGMIGATVKIGSFAPRAVASTPSKSIPHFPMGAGFHPVYSRLCSKDNGHALFGSLLALADGDPISGGGAHLHNSCQDIGIFSPHTFRPTKNKDDGIKMGLQLFLPTSVIIPIPTGKTIITNPIPAPFNPIDILKKILLNCFGKLAKKVKSRLIKFNHSGKCPKGLKKMLCRFGFEPINLINGAVIYEGSDFDIAGPIALNWTRQWYSDSPYIGWLGHGVHCNYDRAVELYPELGTAGLRMDDGRIVAFPELIAEQEFYLREEKTTLKKTQNGYQAYDHSSRLFYDFTLFDGRKYQLTKIFNHDGLAIVFEFNAFRLTKIIDAAGRIIKVSTKNGFVEKLELEGPDGLEPLITYEYDELYNMIAIIDAIGNPTRIEYDKNLMVKKTDRNGQAFYWEYDNQNRCIHTWGDGGWQEGWMEYHAEDGYNLVTDANKAVTTYHYDSNQLITEIEDPMGNSTFYDYTEYMELYREIDQEGRILGFAYDERGNKTATTYPDGTQEMIMYDEENRPFVAIDPEGEKTVYLYEKGKVHQLKTIIAPDKSLTNFTYNEEGMLRTVAKNNSKLELVYDTAYNLIEWRENDQKLKTWEYDHRGRVRAVYTPMQMADYFTYDALDRVQKIIEKDSNIIEFDYNNYDEVTGLRDQKNNIKFSYTPMGSLALREQNGVKVRFDYDKMEQLTKIKNEDNETYYFDRNKAGHIMRETAFDGLIKKYSRNRAGEVTKIDHGGGKITEYEQDALGRITRADYHDGTWETYTYNKNGLLIEAVNQNVSIQFKRDAAGRIIKEIQKQQLEKDENAITLTAEYNMLGQRTNIKTSLGADINTHYNQKGQLERIEAQSNELKEQHKTWETTLKRDELGREIERFATGGLHIKTSYNNSGKQKEQEVFANGKRTGARYYNWDTNQQLRSTVNQLTSSITYFDYDEFGNLAKADYNGKGELYKTPDAVGNLYKTADRSDRKYGKGGKLLKDEKYFYKYDQWGNLIHKSTRDINSPLIFEKLTNIFDKLIGNKAEETRLQEEHEKWQPGDSTYNWFANGMLESVTNSDGKIVSFEYDALGRRTAKIAEKEINRYFWDGNVLIHEWKYDLKDKPKLITFENDLVYDKPESLEKLITWIYEEGSFVPSAKIFGNEKFSIINDYIGRPVQAYNEIGSLVWETDYDIYGGLKDLKGDRSFIPFRQLGQYEDLDTELYYNRFRYYDSDAGIYLSQDPIGLAGINPNLYAYTHDTNRIVDLFGLSSFDPFSVGEITPFPKDLHFGQNRVAPSFSDIGSQASDSIRGRSISDVAEGLRSGDIDPNVFVISYTIDPISGKPVTLNNRGLAALAESGKLPDSAIFVPYDKAPKHLVSDFQGKGPSKTIAVTRNKDGSGLIRKITNCN